MVLVSTGHGTGSARPSPTAPAPAFGAGAAIALQLVLLRRAPFDSGVAPLITGRAVSSVLILTAAGLLRRRPGAQRPAYLLSAARGRWAVNLLFLLAVRSGPLTVVAAPTRPARSCRPAAYPPNASTAASPSGWVPPSASPPRPEYAHTTEHKEHTMLVHPWDAALDETEWQDWIARGHDFGQLCVNGLPGHPPAIVPTHFTVDGDQILIHLARPNPVWAAVERDPNVVLTVIGDYAFVPGPWRAPAATPTREGVPTSYYAAVQFTCRAAVVDDPRAKAELLRRQMAHFQPDGDHAPVTVDQPPYGRLLSGIRGLRLQVTGVTAKFKYDDHKPVEHRTAVADRLTGRGRGLDVSAAHQQRRRLDRIGPWKP